MLRKLSFAVTLGIVTGCVWFACSSQESLQADGRPLLPDVKGKVTAVGEDGLLTVSVGSDTGWQEGDRLELFRVDPKPQYFGALQLIEVKSKESVGKMLTPKFHKAIQPGDLVANRLLPATQGAGGVPASGELGGAILLNQGKAPNFVHTVIFYLKKDAPAGEIDALIADAHKMLAKIPSVRELKIGRPAEKSTPGFAVKDYHLGLLVLFDNYDGLKTYDEHPLHKEYVQKHLPHIEKVLVYDFENKPTK